MPGSNAGTVFVTGATGLVGSALCARLYEEGYAVVQAGHRPRPTQPPASGQWVSIEMKEMRSAEQWLPLLKDVDAVMNCAGILQDGAGETTDAVHREGPAALFAACERAGIGRVIHLSAIGVNREQPSAFSKTKAEGDAALVARDLDWVILRPSVILGRAAYGGSALFRGLAALPAIPSVPGAGKLQVVRLDDVVATILFFLQKDAPAKLELDLAGPELLTF
jgi:uncharacterized protein YbjT (DUF2867 family)